MRLSPAGKFWLAYLAALLVVVLICKMSAGHLFCSLVGWNK